MTYQSTSTHDHQREWWVIRWLELLDSYRFKKRLERARNYAREGNVLSIEFKGAEVIAKVQGSEAEPYQVKLSIEQFSDEDWQYVMASMAEKAIFSAKLLAGEMPKDIEEVFISNGLSLFPFQLKEVHSKCSCPDKANPCKHIGAVYYQLADRFSEDPFVIFQLRGRTKQQILDKLREIRNQQSQGQIVSPELIEQEEISEDKTNNKNILDYESYLLNFWHYKEPLEPSLVVITPPTDNKTILDILGRIPLTPEDAEAITQYLNQVYQTASQQAMITALNPAEKD